MTPQPEAQLTHAPSSPPPAAPASAPKRQPWKAIWPAPREPASQTNLFGFAKGEEMVFDGNAGNFFARSEWSTEAESSE